MDAPCVATSRVTQKIFAVLVEWYHRIVLTMSFKLVSFLHLLMVNGNCGRITYRLWEIIAYKCWKSPFSHTAFWLSINSGGMSSNISVIDTSLKSTFSGLQFCRWQQESVLTNPAVQNKPSTSTIFISLAVVAAQICEILPNSEIIRTYIHLTSSTSSTLVPIESSYATPY